MPLTCRYVAMLNYEQAWTEAADLGGIASGEWDIMSQFRKSGMGDCAEEGKVHPAFQPAR